MKKLACRDTGREHCRWIVFADGDEQILRHARDHVAQRHGEAAASDLDERLKSAIREV